MRTLLNLIELYFLNLKTPFIIKLLISYLLNAQKGAFRVIIRPSFQSYFTSLKLAFSLAIIKAINNLTLPLMAVINCSLKLIRYQQFRDPFRRPLPRCSCGISTIIILKSSRPLRHVNRGSPLRHFLRHPLRHPLKYPLGHPLGHSLGHPLGHPLRHPLRHPLGHLLRHLLQA